jgi:large subunit ribosomal protein L24
MSGFKRSSVKPQPKFHVRKDDTVEVISGSHRGSKGRVLQILTKRNRVVIEGVGLFKKHVRPSQTNPKGGVEEREGSIHISNVRKVEGAKAAKAAK